MLTRRPAAAAASAGQLYGLEKFWAFLKYSRRSVTIDAKLQSLLSSYRRLEDFRVPDEVGWNTVLGAIPFLHFDSDSDEGNCSRIPTAVPNSCGNFIPIPMMTIPLCTV